MLSRRGILPEGINDDGTPKTAGQRIGLPWVDVEDIFDDFELVIILNVSK